MSASTYLRLEVISGNAPGSTLVVEDELTIGRHATGAGRLSEDEEISRQHARISHEATGNYAIEDLGSSNGTFVNGLRIQTPRILALGDSIETGATTLVVKEIVKRQPPEAAAVGSVEPGADARAAPTVFARVPSTEEVAPTPQAGAAEPVQPAVEGRAAPTVFAPVPSTAEPAQQAPAAATVFAPVPSTEEAAPAAEIPAPRLSLEIDFDAREARLALGEGGETVRLVFSDGAWRVAQEG